MKIKVWEFQLGNTAVKLSLITSLAHLPFHSNVFCAQQQGENGVRGQAGRWGQRPLHQQQRETSTAAAEVSRESRTQQENPLELQQGKHCSEGPEELRGSEVKHRGSGTNRNGEHRDKEPRVGKSHRFESTPAFAAERGLELMADCPCSCRASAQAKATLTRPENNPWHSDMANKDLGADRIETSTAGSFRNLIKCTFQTRAHVLYAVFNTQMISHLQI